jgi:flagellar hook assembly protein FlgD
MIFDFSGRLVFDRTVTEETKGYRTSSVTWNGTNNSGSYLPGGIYICKLIVTNEEGVSSAVTGKFVLTR